MPNAALQAQYEFHILIRVSDSWYQCTLNAHNPTKFHLATADRDLYQYHPGGTVAPSLKSHDLLSIVHFKTDLVTQQS